MDKKLTDEEFEEWLRGSKQEEEALRRKIREQIREIAGLLLELREIL